MYDSPDSAPWIDRLKLDEFALLNWSWAGRVESVGEAVRAMSREGIGRLAPIAFDLQFDPAYYREVHPEYGGMEDAAVYERWLTHDIAMAWPGSAEQHLRWLGLALREYPAAFDWRRFIERTPQAGPNRWSAIEHLTRSGFDAHQDLPVSGEGAAEFLHALGLQFRGRNDLLSVSAFQQARRAGDCGYDAAHQLADAFYRLERWPEALSLFEEAAGHESAGLWTFVNGARSALKLGLHEQAFDFVTAGKLNVAGDYWWREVLREAIEAEFSAAFEQARGLYASARREEADALLTEAVERTAARWSALDPLGKPLQAAPGGRVVMLANTDLRQCNHYRIEQKQQLFKALGREFEVFDSRNQAQEFITALPGAAAALFYRLPAFPMNVRAIDTARAMGVPTFYDIDDLIFDAEAYPEPFHTYGAVTEEFYQSLQIGVPLFRAAMGRCDHGIASTTALAGHMAKVVRSGRVAVLPNGLDDRNAWALQTPPARVRGDRDVVIFYGSGTTAHNSDFMDLAGPALLEAFQRRPNVRLMVAGHLDLDARFDEYADRITRFSWVGDVRSYWSMLAEADINLAVLAPYPTTDAKSEIKWLEAAVLGAPSLVSSTHRYREVLEDGVDALIAADPAEWSQKLEQLIAEPELRAQLVARARDKAARQYSLQANARRLEEALAPASAPAAPALLGRAPKKRLLLQNIFFPPQTIGGSTRVLRDNLDAFLDMGLAEEFEFAVAASDNGASHDYQLRVEEYRGATVFRFGPPGQVNLEWKPFDPRMGEMFSTVLESWRPDLVHFHAVQRLTGSVIEACLDKGVPYVVTLHDAWYVSDWHFLVDDKGRVRSPCEPVPFDPPAPVTVGEALDRRRRIRPLLTSAEAVLGVSHTFTEMHRACGIEARALPNGVPPMRPAERRPSAAGRVRLCHVGSMTPHKGYTLVQAALKQGDFRNLELTVVDHRRFGGDEERDLWGGTPVRFVGKTPQERMHDFYAGQDVLLAPSIWPESFGLVSREALAAGLWVVASDIGAMGEDVTPGLNGWVVDVSTVEALLNVFREIDADPARFLQSPPPVRLRTAADQARELVEVYREILNRPGRRFHPDALAQVRAGRPEPEPKTP